MRLIVTTIKACVLLAGAPFIAGQAQTQGNNYPVKATQAIVTKATVENVNKDKREVTLKREDGSTVTVEVPDTVRNFDQIKKGDTVTVTYNESIAMSVRKSDEPASATETHVMARAPLGAKPSATQVSTTQIVATVEKIDRKTREVSLLAPDGSTTTVKVPEDIKKFDQLKTGDQVVVNATQSLAIDVCTPEK
jgi:translation initiation factor IF-1